APAFGGFLVHGYSFSAIFVVSGAVGLLALLLSLLLPRDRQKADDLKDDDDDLTLKQFFLIFKERRLLPVYAVIVINMFMLAFSSDFSPFTFIPSATHHLKPGAVLSVATLSYLLIQPFAGYLADRVEIRITVLAG